VTFTNVAGKDEILARGCYSYMWISSHSCITLFYYISETYRLKMAALYSRNL